MQILWLQDQFLLSSKTFLDFGQTFLLPSNYLHDWLCIQANDDDDTDIKSGWKSPHRKKVFHLKKKSWGVLLKGLFWLFLRFCWLFCTPVVVDSERLLQWEFLEVLLAPNWYFMSREREEEGKFHLSIVQSRAARKSAQFSVMKAFCACPPRSIFLDCEKSKQLNLNSNLRKQLSHFLWNLQGANHVNQQMLLVFVYQKHSFIDAYCLKITLNVSFQFCHFCQFWRTFVHSKCKRSSLRSQFCKMRLFLWISNIVQDCFQWNNFVLLSCC